MSSYTLLAELVDAVRIMAEASSPGPTLGNPEAIVARIQAKYRNGMNDTNIPTQRLLQPNGLAVKISASAERLDVLNKTDEVASPDLSKRNTQTSSYWMAAMKQRGSSPFAESAYKVCTLRRLL